MRLLIFGILLSLSAFVFADSGFPSTSSNTATNTSSTTGTTTGSDSFGSLVQQQTAQAMKTFQNVNYQKLSGGENQSSFYDSSSDDQNPPDPDHLFHLFSGS